MIGSLHLAQAKGPCKVSNGLDFVATGVTYRILLHCTFDHIGYWRHVESSGGDL